jgi:hypothetical protein
MTVIPQGLSAVAPILRRLTEGGWQPITACPVSPARVRAERYGTGDQVYLVLHNPPGEAVDATVHADLATLGWTGCVASKAQTGETVATTAGALRLPLKPEETATLLLQKR